MALDAGVMHVTIEFAKDLKDGDWFGKQDPYCVVKCGGQSLRTRTAVDGGKSPVWNETFQFNCINENSIDMEIKDEDVGKDDVIGIATFSLAKAREAGTDRISAPVLSKKSRKQHGFVSVSLKWEPNRRPQAQQAQAQAQAPPVFYAGPQQPYAYAPQPAYYAAPAPAGYYAAPPPAYFPAPSPAYSAAPPATYAQPQPQAHQQPVQVAGK